MGTVDDLNRRFIDEQLARLQGRLERLLACERPGGDEAAKALDADDGGCELHCSAEVWEKRQEIPLLRIASVLGLTDFERELLLLATAPEIDPWFGSCLASLQGGVLAWPTVALAWRLFCPARAQWFESRDGLRPDSPLLRFDVLSLDNSDWPLPQRPVRVDPRVADAILGRRWPDARLAGRLRYREADTGNALSPRVATIRGPFLIALHGAPLGDLEDYAAEALAGLGVPLLAADVDGMERGQAVALVRESLLEQTALFLGGAEAQASEWMRLLQAAGALAFIGSQERPRRPPAWPAGSWLSVHVPLPSREQRASLWQTAAGTTVASDITAWPLSPRQIRETADAARARSGPSQCVSDDALRGVCREGVQHRMAEVAQQLRSHFRWSDLVVPDDALAKLQELCQQARHQPRVLSELGFGVRLPRGRGVSALLAGPSGTGKTMAAEVIAHELQRDLYRVDLSRVVSKYIGETEKNLRAVFEAAEQADCVVLFDEADALFGKRTEVKDSHDRYANLEVSYLLQQMEEVERAVILLATNRRQAIDEAFLRRFRFVIDFPAPEAPLREQLWRRAFPAEVRVQGVDFSTLAHRLVLTGASIKNIALAATCLAAADGGVVTAALLAHAATRELEKLGRPIALQALDVAGQELRP
ncbi:MAG: ATP-binding protein [Pirellulales bacterium]